VAQFQTLVAELALENRILRAALQQVGYRPPKAAMPSSSACTGKEPSLCPNPAVPWAWVSGLLLSIPPLPPTKAPG